MKQRVPVLVLWLLSAVWAHSAALDVKLNLTSRKMYTGSLMGLSGQKVTFQPNGSSTAVSIPVASIASVEFKFNADQQSKISRLMAEGRYEELDSELKTLLPAYLPYAALPANLEEMLSRWVTASYWTGDYDQVQNLMAIAPQVKSPKLVNLTLFYGMLARLDQGESQSVEAFLDTEKGLLIFPEGSAARLYIQTRLLQLDKQYVPAIRMAADLLATHGRDADWAPQAELLCEELYFQTGRPESAQAVLGSINECYTSPLIIKKAAAIAAQNGMEKK